MVGSPQNPFVIPGFCLPNFTAAIVAAADSLKLDTPKQHAGVSGLIHFLYLNIGLDIWQLERVRREQNKTPTPVRTRGLVSISFYRT
jgi:hypothetical protein